METNFVIILTVLACLSLSFFFSGMEAGVFALSRVRIRQQMRAGKPSARLLHGYLENPEKFLWTILVGNTVANFVALCLIVAGLHQRLSAHPAWFVLAFLVIVFLLYAVSDLLPKMLFRIFPNPNPGAFTVELPAPATLGITFRIIGLTGQAMLERPTEPGLERQTVNAGNLPPGLYFLEVVSEGRVLAVEKFVKQ